jgi:hypothetical protein
MAKSQVALDNRSGKQNARNTLALLDNGSRNLGRFRTGQPGTHPLAARGLDQYPTPKIAIEALLEVEPELLRARIWEPCAGDGDVVRILKGKGIHVIASDIEQGDFALNFLGDFLWQERAPNGCNVILTNAPFAQSAKIVRHALTLVPDVYLLQRLAFYESLGRVDLMEHSGLAAVYVFRKRLPRMHRKGWTGKKASSSIAAWFHWRRGYDGLTVRIGPGESKYPPRNTTGTRPTTARSAGRTTEDRRTIKPRTATLSNERTFNDGQITERQDRQQRRARNHFRIPQAVEASER